MIAKKESGKRSRAGRPKADHSPEREGENTAREKLLDSAARLFARQGIAATSLAKVAAEAGLTSAMIHYYFKNKDQLVEAVVAERLARFLGQVIVENKGSDPADYLLATVTRLVEACRNNPWMPALWVREMVSDGGALRPYLPGVLPIGLIGELVASFRSGIEEGLYPEDLEPGLTLFSAVSMIMLPLAAKDLLEQIPGLGRLNPDKLAGHVKALLSRGLLGGTGL